MCCVTCIIEKCPSKRRLFSIITAWPRQNFKSVIWQLSEEDCSACWIDVNVKTTHRLRVERHVPNATHSDVDLDWLFFVKSADIALSK